MNKNYICNRAFDLILRNNKRYTFYFSRYKLNDTKELFDNEVNLSNTEAAYYSGLKAEKRKIEYMMGRICVKNAMQYAFNVPMSRTEVRNGIFTQPVLNDPAWEVSITHISDEAACLLYPREIVMGIDIESINAKNDYIMKTIALRTEFEEIYQMLKNESVAYSVIWTIKEALSKALRTGFTLPFEIMRICPEKMIEKFRMIESSFQNFAQYRARSWIFDDKVISIVFPAITYFDESDFLL